MATAFTITHELKRLQMAVIFAAVMLAGLMSARAQVLEFPLHGSDINPGERVVTGVHATAGGSQTGAKDLGIVRWAANTNWPKLIKGKTDESINSNYLVYGRPVHAMASGTVVACWRNAPENTGHTKHAEYNNKKILLQGNHLWIRQADGNFALYAHAQTGDIPESLCPNNAELLTKDRANLPLWTDPETVVTNGATVTAGQLLFHVGNSGNSSEPHLHVQLNDKSNNWLPMKFARGQTTPFLAGIASLNGPWTRLQGSALPMASILVWPPHPIGSWTYNNVEGPAYQRVFEHFVDSGVMADTVTCKNNGAIYDTTWIPAKGAWVSHHGMSATDFVVRNTLYMQQGYNQKSIYNCGKVVAVWRKP